MPLYSWSSLLRSPITRETQLQTSVTHTRFCTGCRNPWRPVKSPGIFIHNFSPFPEHAYRAITTFRIRLLEDYKVAAPILDLWRVELDFVLGQENRAEGTSSTTSPSPNFWKGTMKTNDPERVIFCVSFLDHTGERKTLWFESYSQAKATAQRERSATLEKVRL